MQLRQKKIAGSICVFFVTGAVLAWFMTRDASSGIGQSPSLYVVLLLVNITALVILVGQLQKMWADNKRAKVYRELEGRFPELRHSVRGKEFAFSVGETKGWKDFFSKKMKLVIRANLLSGTVGEIKLAMFETSTVVGTVYKRSKFDNTFDDEAHGGTEYARRFETVFYVSESNEWREIKRVASNNYQLEANAISNILDDLLAGNQPDQS